MSDYSQELDIAEKLARLAGEKVMPYFGSDELEIQSKGPHNPVTEADFLANTVIVEGLKKHFENDAILSEETDDQLDRETMNRNRFKTKRVWIIDPIDGTREFIRNNPQFAISIALVVDHEPVVGVVYNPAREEMFSGAAGIGVFVNNKEIHPAQKAIKSMSDLEICISRSEMKKGHFDKLLSNSLVKEENAIGSVAYKLGLVASRRFDLVLSVKPKNEWDIAGGGALLNQLGYSLLDKTASKITFNKEDTVSYGLIAGRPEAVDLYLDFLNHSS